MLFSLLVRPRANRCLQPGRLYHLMHHSHDRKFLSRIGTVRTESPDEAAISRMMQKLEGGFAERYNLRTHHRGAFWSDRYHCTLVDGGACAWNGMKHIDLNRVRAPVVTHSSEWKWKGRFLTGLLPKSSKRSCLTNRQR